MVFFKDLKVFKFWWSPVHNIWSYGSKKSLLIPRSYRILKFTQQSQETRIARTISKQSKTEVLILHIIWHYKIYYKPTVIKTVWYWWKNRNLNQWKRSDFRNRCKHTRSTDFWQRSQVTEWRKEKPSPSSARTIGHPHAKIQKQKNLNQRIHHITSNPELKMYLRPKCKTLNF